MLHLDDPTARHRTAYHLWLDTYRRTYKPRHLATARACLAMAEEAGGKPLARQAMILIRNRVLRVTAEARQRAIDAATSAPHALAQAPTPYKPSGT